MKFIRDIISEKANLAGRAEREQTLADMAEEPPRDAEVNSGQADDFPADLDGADVDIIHKVASGRPSLNNAAEYAFAAGDPAETDQGFEVSADYQAMIPPALDGADDEDSRDGFDPLTATNDLEDDRDRDDPSELFGDLWPETAQDGPEEDFSHSDDDAAQAAQVEMPAAATTPETPAIAQPDLVADRVSTPAPPPPARPATRVILSGAPPVSSDAASTPAPEESSAFQRMVQRDRHSTSDMPPRRAQSADEIRDEASDEMPLEAPVEMPQSVKMPAPAAGRAARHAGRVKTRLLGFNTAQDTAPDPFDSKQVQAPVGSAMYPVGWMVVTDGPGRGHAFTLFDGVSQIGRGEDQAIRLDFGDNSISRTSHAAIAYDGEQHAFFLGHGGKANLVRLNGNPVLSTEKLSTGALIRIGETTLRFVALCGNEFDWGSCQDDDIENAQFG